MSHSDSAVPGDCKRYHERQKPLGKITGPMAQEPCQRFHPLYIGQYVQRNREAETEYQGCEFTARTYIESRNSQQDQRSECGTDRMPGKQYPGKNPLRQIDRNQCGYC